MTLSWSKLQLLTSALIGNIPNEAGIYRLTYKATDGSYYAFYVGRSETSIKEDLGVITKGKTDNPCIKSHLENLECYFRYALVKDPEERKNAERSIYDHFKPKCNLEIPGGQLVEVNLN